MKHSKFDIITPVCRCLQVIQNISNDSFIIQINMHINLEIITIRNIVSITKVWIINFVLSERFLLSWTWSGSDRLATMIFFTIQDKS